ALIAAIKDNDDRAALALLAQGADANARDTGEEDLSLWQQVRCLFDRMQGKKAHEQTALMLAVEQGRFNYLDYADLVQALLDKGADMHVTDKEGSPPLLLACMSGQMQVTRILAERGAGVNVKDINAFTPLIYAIMYDDAQTVQVLLRHGADVNAQDAAGG